MTRTLIASAFFVCAPAASAGSPVAITAGDLPQARISYGDVDVHSAIGRVTVERRIRLAAELLCVDGQVDPAPIQPLRSYGECFELALGSGMSQLDEIASE